MGLTSKQIYTLMALVAIIGGFALIVSLVSHTLKGECPQGEIPDSKAKNGCRVKCDTDDNEGCRDCTHWDYSKNRCVKCDPTYLTWDGSKCVGQNCGGHGVWDPDNHKCNCTKAGTEYPPPATTPVTPGWDGDLCQNDRNRCDDEYITTKLVADTFTRTVDEADTKINMWFGETWKYPASVSGAQSDICREVIGYPEGAKKKLLCAGTSKDCWEKWLSQDLYGKTVKCQDVCAGKGVPRNTPGYAGCACVCDAGDPLHQNSAKKCALDWGTCNGICKTVNKTKGCPQPHPGSVTPPFLPTCRYACSGGGADPTCNDKDHMTAITAAECVARGKDIGTCTYNNCLSGGMVCGGVPGTPGQVPCSCVPPPKA